jgi:hypothetical protein
VDRFLGLAWDSGRGAYAIDWPTQSSRAVDEAVVTPPAIDTSSSRLC